MGVTKDYLDGNKAGEIWAVALTEEGRYLAGTSFDGRINVWDLHANRTKIREFETKGSFGMSIDIVRGQMGFLLLYSLTLVTQSADGKFTASGHENGGVYIFNNDSGRLQSSLPGRYRRSPSLIVTDGCQAMLSLCVLWLFRQVESCWQQLVTPRSLLYTMSLLVSRWRILRVMAHGCSPSIGMTRASTY